jgi:hypothetical protein
VDVDADIHAAVLIAPADSPKTATSISPPCTGCACPVDDDLDLAAGGHDMQLLCQGIDGFYIAGGGRQARCTAPTQVRGIPRPCCTSPNSTAKRAYRQFPKKRYNNYIITLKGKQMHSSKHVLVWLQRMIIIALVIAFTQTAPVSATPQGLARDYPAGFNEQFTSSASNWGISSGRWSYGGGLLRGNGVKNGFSKVMFSKATYANFDYMVKMRRTGCPNCSNTLVFRSTSRGALYFGYNNMGSYSIYACTTGGCTPWKKWTATTAIIQGGYNVLRVVTVGNTYQFYINNKLMTQGTGMGFSSGYVGMEFFSWVTAGNYLDIDYAILNKK